MDKEFVPVKESFVLKELEFEGPSLKYWNDYGKGAYKRFQLLYVVDNWCQTYARAPLFSQAFRWFRKRYKLSGIPTHNSYEIWDTKSEECIIEIYPVDSYEKAELACLRKLIKIVKEQKLKRDA